MTRSKTFLLPIAGLLSLTCFDSVAQTPGESYYSLGTSLQEQERHEEAVEAFDDALQLLRENGGLYDLEQLPILQARLDSTQALSSWEDVDAGKQLAYQIAVRNPAAGTSTRYQTLRELGLWKLRVAEEGLLPNSLNGVRDAASLYRRELDQPDIRAAYDTISISNLYLDLAALEFLQAKEKLALPLSEYSTGGSRTTTQMYCQTIYGPDGRAREVCRSVQVPNLEYFMGLSDRKYDQIRDHLDAMKESVLQAYEVLLREVGTPNRTEALALLAEVHRLTDAFNGFVAENSRKSESRIAAPTGSIIRQ
jgi:tetratricopeptide (TPR) repeat protein